MVLTKLARVPSTHFFELHLVSHKDKMPWKAQVCPFCQKRYVNKTRLRNHLSENTSESRFPADGIHDVLQIKHVLHRLSPSAHEPDEHR